MIGPDPAPYEAMRNPNLPWGYWLIIDAAGNLHRPLVDEYGSRWESLREALWRGRLSMGFGDGLSPRETEQLEFLLAVLAAISRSVVSTHEGVLDLFNGQWSGTAHYTQWLTGQTLIEPSEVLANTKLTPEGYAVLLMLAATRDREKARVPVGRPSLHQFAELRPGVEQDAIDANIAAIEAALPAGLPCRFTRHQLGRSPAVVLVGPANAEMVHRETIWSVAMPSALERDRLYLWLLQRADRWEAWLEIVRKHSARPLTEHLLALFIAQLTDAEIH